MPPLTTEFLASLVAQRRKCLVQLRDLGKRQDEAVAADDMTSLMQLLAAKQQLVVALQRIEGELDPFREQDPETRVWSPAAARAECAAQAADCRRLLEEIMAAEQRTQDQLVLRRDEVGRQLRSTTSHRQIRQAYRQHS